MSFVAGNDTRDIPLDGDPNDIDLSNDGKYLAVAIHKGQPCIRVFTTEDGKSVGEFGEGEWTGFGVAFVDGGKSLCYLTWDEEQRATLWKVELPSGKPKKLESLTDESRCKFLERDREGTMVAVGGHAVLVFDAETAKQRLRVICNLKGAEGCAHFSDDKRIWVYGSESASLIQYDLATGKQLENLEAPSHHGMQVVGSPDGRWLVGVGPAGRGVALYDLENDTRITADNDDGVELDDSAEFSGAFAFSHDSKMVLFPTRFVASLTLPERELAFSKKLIGEAGDRAVRAAGALAAPLVAFAYHRGKKVVLVPTAAAT